MRRHRYRRPCRRYGRHHHGRRRRRRRRRRRLSLSRSSESFDGRKVDKNKQTFLTLFH